MSHNRVFQNAKWIVICKIIQAVFQLVIGMISARYLGPSNYGLISYAGSVVAFAVPVMQLGMRSTLVQEYVTKPEKEGAILGTSLVMNTLSGLACMIGVVCFTMAMNRGETITIIVCSLYCISLVFQAAEMMQYWFQAKLLSKYSSLMMLGGYIVVSGYKILLLITGKSVYWFALAHSVEYGVNSILLMLAYKKQNGASLSFSMELAKDMFSRSKYYIVANLMVTVFQNTDHVMLKMLVGDAENGFYTTAVTCANVANFVYNAVLDTGRPVILKSRQKSQCEFEKNVCILYAILIYLTFVQGVCFSVLAKWIVRILYGEAYLMAVPVLKIIIWQVLFSYLGSVRNIWILSEGKHNVLWVINLSGAIANVILNAMFIPRWGACGAAFASVMTQLFTNCIVGFFYKPIRRNNMLMVKSIHPQYLWELYKMWAS